MKAHDSWPGNKAEEGRLPNSMHTDTHTEANCETHRVTHSCIWDLTQHQESVVRPAYGP